MQVEAEEEALAQVGGVLEVVPSSTLNPKP